MDVAIVSCHECFFSKNAESHIRLFFDKLVSPDKHKMDVKLKSFDLKDLEHSKSAADVHQCKVQIVIISHHFLQRLKLESTTRLRVSPVNRVFRAKRVIAVLAGGVTANEISEGYQSLLARFGEWICLELRSTNKLDPDFSKKFTDLVIKIYNLEQCSSSNFSVFPKKITREQSKIYIFMKKPITLEDEIRVDFTSGKKCETSSYTKVENPFTLSVRVPAESLCPEKVAYVEVCVYVNGGKLGGTCIKADLHSRSGDDDVVEKMIKMVPGFLKLFDEHIKEALIKNFRECTDFRTDPSLELMNDVLICKGDEFPTVMHFVAYHGLEHTAYTVLDEADGLEQCKTTNDNGMNPMQMAKIKGNENVSQIIRDYQEISTSCEAFQLYKKMYARESVLVLGQQEIVSKSLPAYQNLPETDIISDEAETVEPLQNSTTESSASPSYVALGDDDASSPTPTSIDHDKRLKPLSQKPVPIARNKSPRSTPKNYVNVEAALTPPHNSTLPSSQTHAPEVDVVRLRQRKEKIHIRDYVRRQSISPSQIQDYDIPRLEREEYSIPPPDAKPLEIQTLEQPHQGSPVLVKKGTESIPVTTDGYIFMDHDDSKEKETFPEHIVFKEGQLVSDVTVKQSQQSSQPNFSHHDSELVAGSGGRLLNDGDEMGRKGSLESLPFALDRVDEELIALMKNFPNSGFTVQQVELLFENWKSRPDVINSIEAKKHYMKKVREEYRRMQNAQGGKAASLMGKIKDVLTGKKKSISTSPKLDQFNRKFSLQDVPKYRESLGSGSVDTDPGVTETDPHHARTITMLDSPKPYRNPLDRRFCPSAYIGPDTPLPLPLPSPTEVTPPSTTVVENSVKIPNIDYQIPPPPRPLTAPPVPQKPPRKEIPPSSDLPVLSPSAAPPSQEGPPLPRKPSHLRGIVPDECEIGVDGEEPPPPPPRTYVNL